MRKIKGLFIFFVFFRHCGLDPQSPCYGGIPAFAGMTTLDYANRNAFNIKSGKGFKGFRFSRLR